MNPECDDRVQLSKSDKNIGAGGWRVDNLFEAGDSGDVLVHPRITSGHIYIQIHSLPAGGSVHPKNVISVIIYALTLSQTCIHFFHVLNTIIYFEECG